MKQTTLEAKVRKVTGRKVKSLRAEGILPANVYGKHISSTAIGLSEKEFLKAFAQVGETGLLSLKVVGEKGKSEARSVLVANLQKNPVSDRVLHVDFRQVDLKEKIEAEVPLELTGESPVEKQGLGTVVQYVNEIEVEALPTDLPEKFVLDISNLKEVGQAFYAKDLKVEAAKVQLKTDLKTILVKVEPPQKEEVAPPPAETVAAEGEVTPTEGEVPPAEKAEGEGEKLNAPAKAQEPPSEKPQK